ncbi:MAG: ATP-binding cassette domain-containing protein [Muribaculaceae bacterium]
MEILLEGVSDTLQYAGVKLNNAYGFKINKANTYVVIGENGCGKSTLGNIIEKGWNIATNVIAGNKQAMKIKSIEFTDIHALTGCKDTYYQQRFEATSNEAIPTVDELITGKISDELWNELCDKLSLNDIRNKRINFLSSGELRKFLIINLFTEKPDILIIDNPYIGLDVASRALFNSLIKSISSDGTAIIMMLCNPIDIPEYTDYILPMQSLNILPMIKVSGETEIEMAKEKINALFNATFDLSILPKTEPMAIDYSTAFELKDCIVSYGKTTILKNVSWKVEAGEHWALLGENGAGKSTLLSLIYADNPQGYRNDITLFDHRRGTGESIWDIKKKIGYISPEMHLYFNNGEDTLTVVASGLHDNVGCFRKLSEEQKAIAMLWLKAVGMEHLSHRRFPTLSSGEQRLALLIRTFLKNASLLILDEPLHGLDMARKRLVAALIAKIASRPSQSLIYVTHYEKEIPTCVTHRHILTKLHS